MAGLAAARLADPVAHSNALGGFLAGALVGLAAATAVAVVVGLAATAVAAEIATAGLATPLVAGVAVTVAEFGVNAVVGGGLMKLAEDEGERLGGAGHGAASGAVAQGSVTVLFNGRPAARTGDAESCHAGVIVQGSATVLINGRPAARVTDKTSCGAAIIEGSPNIWIGGPVATTGSMQSEVPSWARWAAIAAGLLPALGAAARAIGPAIAEVQATGLLRAAQTGAKAVGRALEARAGGVRPPAPFQNEPMIPPGAKVSTGKFEAKRPGGLDVRNLSASDSAAAEQLRGQGWSSGRQEEVLNSGRDFRVQPGKQGDNMYGFSSSDPKFAKTGDSPYWMDEPTFQDMQARRYDPATDKWDSPNVKNELALPCYNAADTLYRGQLTENQPLVTSTIGQAQETVTYANPNGTSTVFTRTMTGGGTQTAPKLNGIGGITKIGGGP